MTEQEAAVLAEDRLRLYTRREGRCLVWTRARNKRGYGKIQIAKQRFQPHRLAWILHHGQPIPPGMDVKHSCDNPPCCDSAHLSIGTRSDNMREAVVRGRWRGYGAGLNRTHCRNGHEFTEANTRVHPSGKRICRACACAASKRYRTKVA